MNFWKLQILNGSTGQNFVDECLKDERITTHEDYAPGFLSQAKKGDIVLIHKGTYPVCLVKIKYKIDNLSQVVGTSFGHDYKIEVVSWYEEIKANKNVFDNNFVVGHNGTYSLLKNDSATLSKIKRWYHYIIKKNSMKEILNILKYKRQIILQGPPGTGKTREAKLLAEAIASKNVAENISHKHIGDIIYEGLILKTKENYSFQVKEVDIQIKRIIIIPQSAPVNEYPVTFDQILKCYESKGWNDKISQWNQNGNASYLVSISKHIYDFLLEKNKDTIKTVQFHPSYTYEDFVRGIIAKPNDDGEGITYEAENKILGKFVEDAMKNLDGLQKSSLNIYDEEVFEQFRLSIILKITEDEKYELTNNIYISEVDEKKFKYKGDNWKRHPKGLNIRFSELKKVIESNPESRQNIIKNTSLKSLTKSHATYFFELYTKYKEFYETNKNDLISIEGEKKYVLIIDEINRANLSAVLGELIYALEYRGEEVESMYEVDGSQKLVLPPNLYIIGTMNTADRSVGHIDYAIRRRFAFVDVLPNILEDNTIVFNKELFEKVSALFINNYNEYFNDSERKVILQPAETLSSEFRPEDVWLGHSYFIQKKLEDDRLEPEDFRMKIDYEIKPILMEYVKDGILVGKIGEQKIEDYIKNL